MCIEFSGALWGFQFLTAGTRQPKNWIPRVASTKDLIRHKKSLHLIHGVDLARAILAVADNFSAGKRWILTDLHVYDWWSIIFDLDPSKSSFILELMIETGTKALPRSPEALERALDSTCFWNHFGLVPSQKL